MSLTSCPEYLTTTRGRAARGGNWFLSGDIRQSYPILSQLYLLRVTLSHLHVPTMMGDALTARSHAVTDPSTRIATCWFCEETSQLGTASWSCCYAAALCSELRPSWESWVGVDTLDSYLHPGNRNPVNLHHTCRYSRVHTCRIFPHYTTFLTSALLTDQFGKSGEGFMLSSLQTGVACSAATALHVGTTACLLLTLPLRESSSRQTFPQQPLSRDKEQGLLVVTWFSLVSTLTRFRFGLWWMDPYNVNRGTDCASITDDILVANRSDGGEGFAYVGLRREEIVEERM
ncbi:hypothetical protein DFP73DRAFT_607768 [Morchella snyderi]|nr:hypothetical protein DFP73DRAFT_607768 [Morchella snyderi]